jgi:carbon starvation protein
MAVLALIQREPIDMLAMPLANAFFETSPGSDRILLRAMPVMVGALCILAIAFRYYSAFLAAKVAALDDSRVTPAHRFNDGQNYHPTNRWVLFGHHFAAISGAGPLIGPVLAMQYGYAPGLIWLLVGVCLAGAVQDMLVMFASVRRDGKSLAEIARTELGNGASIVASMAILFIVIIALAGLAFVVVKALGGEEAKLPAGTRITTTDKSTSGMKAQASPGGPQLLQVPNQCEVQYSPTSTASIRPESFQIALPAQQPLEHCTTTYYAAAMFASPAAAKQLHYEPTAAIILPAGAKQSIPGSSWGTFTIFCTIPIAMFVGFYMYRIRKGRIVEASIIGGVMVLAAVFAGAYVPGSPLEAIFGLSRDQTIIALCVYGFIAAVLPVWMLLTPRDYLSSFMKIGTLALLVLGVILANPTLKHPPLNETWQDGGPTFPGGVFPFVFICVMCGAISGFHALVASGTTPKMIDKERDIRTIGYGAMLTEGLVGLVALIAAASMPLDLYYPINVDVEKEPLYQERMQQMYKEYGEAPGAKDRLHEAGVRDLHKLDLAQMEESVGGESLRGRTGGAVTLAVSMAMIFTDAFSWADSELHGLMKYWYHFAIMFEALFILTTIDAGTRIARYLFQETLGKVYPKFAQPNWLPGAVLATLLVTAGWGILVQTGQINTIWPMFGIANQLLAVMALALVTTMLINSGKGRYALVTLLPMLFVTTTTLTAGKIMVTNQMSNINKGVDTTINAMNMGLTLFVIVCVCTLVLIAVNRWIVVGLGLGSRSS